MAAGAWYSNAGLGDANQALITKSIEFALHETAKNRGILASPVFQGILAADEGLGALTGALGISLSFADVGQGKAAATAEGTEASATNWDETSVTLTPARREYRRVIGDFGRSFSNGLLGAERDDAAVAVAIADGIGVWGNTIVDLSCALASSATNTSGTSGAKYTWNAFHHMSIDHADRGDYGPKVCLLTAKGVKDLSDDAMSLGGAVQMAQQVQQFLSAGSSASGGAAFVGRFFGDVDLYMCSENDTSGSDTLGLCFSANGVHTKHQPVRLPAEAEQILDAGMFTIEGRRPGGSISSLSTVFYNAAGIKQQSGITKITYVT